MTQVFNGDGAQRVLRGLVLAALLLGVPAGAAAQAAAPSESELLREAAQAEAAGELARSVSLLDGILERRAASVPALLAMERVLEIQGRLEELVPRLEAALEDEPRSALLNQVLVRTHSALGQVEALEAAAARWMDEVPGLEVPYREVAAVWEDRGDLERAREALVEGRRRMDRPDALALEMGDLYAAEGALGRAVREWNAAVGLEARGMGQVRRRLRSLPDGGAGVVADLVDLLTAEPASRPRLVAAVELAIDAGLEPRARAAAERVLSDIPESERADFLIDVARRADGARQNRLALWAYQGLAAKPTQENEEGMLLAVRNRVAELALELGDTATAAANYRAVEMAYARGTPQRREAAALRIQLMVAQDPDSARAALREFRREYPDVPELDRLAAAVAAPLVERDPEEATAILAGVRGPRSAYLRGRLAMDAGDVAGARTAFMTAVPGLRGSEATRALALVTLLGTVSDEGGMVVGEAMRLVDAGEPGGAVDLVERRVPELPAEDRPAMLTFAAELADRGQLRDDARRVRRHLLDTYPRSEAAPEALLALARGLRGEGDGALEARELLERLIMEYPRSALVPQARRELQQMTRGNAGDVEKRGSG